MDKSFGLFLAVSAIIIAVIPESSSYYVRPAGRVYRQPPAGMRYRKFARKVEPSLMKGFREVPARKIVRKPFYLPAKSIYGTISKSRRIASKRMGCPTIRHKDIMSVARESLGRINERDGGEILAIKGIERPGVRRCDKCQYGRCVFDHIRSTATLVLAPECRSGNCECGVERDGKVKRCRVSGWTQPGRVAYNIHIRCDDSTVISSAVEVPASRVPVAPRIPVRRPTRPRLETTESTTTTTATTTTATEGPTTTTLPIVTFPPDFDIGAGGRGDRPTEPEGSGFRPAPIINDRFETLDDEYTESAPLFANRNKDISDEGLLQ